MNEPDGVIRVGAVAYLNAKPLVHCLAQLAPQAEILVDLPSRLADGLIAGRFDVALIPSIEHFRNPGSSIVSDACIACDGPVQSVKLFSRVPIERIRSIALDEGSRTSAAMVRILLRERFSLDPETEPLPIGASLGNVAADAVMLIGDRAMRPADEPLACVWEERVWEECVWEECVWEECVWDVGEEWCRWTGLPMVFAMWTAPPGVELDGWDRLFAAARDAGVDRLEEIACQEAPKLGVSLEQCRNYLRNCLRFRLGEREREGLETFRRLAVKHGLVPGGGRQWQDGGHAGHREEPRDLLGPSPEVAGSTRSKLRDSLKKAVAGERLTAAEGLRLLESHDLAALAQAADAVTRRLHPEPYRTYNIDRNINYTNICVAGCRFCAFSRSSRSSEAYLIDRETLYGKIEETEQLGGDQILLQGGLHPDLKIDWYEELLQDISSRFPKINIHGFSPPEIHHIGRVSGLSMIEVLTRLQRAGMGSLPGGGAEILVDRVRREVSRAKISADEWLDVCRQWHALGGRGSATMMFAQAETLSERVEHLDRLRRLQDETCGFTAFICWTFQPDHTALADTPKAGPWEYLKTLAVSRLYLDNFPNLQASWVTQGLKIGQLALRFGANDMGSLMIEENVVAAAGTSFRTTQEELRRAIRQAGYVPRRRNVFYRLLDQRPEESILRPIS